MYKFCSLMHDKIKLMQFWSVHLPWLWWLGRATPGWRPRRRARTSWWSSPGTAAGTPLDRNRHFKCRPDHFIWLLWDRTQCERSPTHLSNYRRDMLLILRRGLVGLGWRPRRRRRCWARHFAKMTNFHFELFCVFVYFAPFAAALKGWAKTIIKRSFTGQC